MSRIKLHSENPFHLRESMMKLSEARTRVSRPFMDRFHFIVVIQLMLLYPFLTIYSRRNARLHRRISTISTRVRVDCV